VYSDFQTWTNAAGCYKGPGSSAKSLGGHAVRIIGWNVDQNGVSYWMIANSWGTTVGNSGIYWVEMGKNVVGIESQVSAPIIKLANPCTGASFCSSAIDLAIPVNNNDPNSPIFLFQGNCTQQVSVSDGKLSAVGSPALIQQFFQGAPAGPIVSSMVSGGNLWLVNPSGEAGSCALAAVGGKYPCGSGTASVPSSGQVSVQFFVGSTSYQWTYVNQSPDNQYMFDSTGSGTPIGSVITDSFSTVSGLLNLDGTTALVYGLDNSQQPISGILKYPTSGVDNSASWSVNPGPMSNSLTCASP